MKTMKWWAFLLVVVVYLAIIQISGLLIGDGIANDDKMATAGNLLKTLTIPVALSMVFAIGLATWLRWWPEIIHEKLRVRKWLVFVPITFLVTAVVMTSWGHLLDQRAILILVLLLTVCLVGFTEELVFRGIGVLAFRGEGLTEGKVALFTSLAFGAAHLSNAIGTGTTAIAQAVVVSFSGYFFYLTRRVAGVIWLPMAIHATWDFAVLSGEIGVDSSVYALTLLAIPVQIVIGLILLKRRKKIEPVLA